jgi:RNA-directed DNA polymerase
MPMERSGARNVAQGELFPEDCTVGLFKGYKRLHWIHSAAKKVEVERFATLMHHFNQHNLRRAFWTLKGSKATGIDRVTKVAYEKNLTENLTNLEGKIQRGGWRPRPSREVLIPKPQGGKRPLAVGCLEDKVVQTLTARILDAIWEPLFYPQSYGFRVGKSAKQAASRLHRALHRRQKQCAVVEVDIEKFFDSMNHGWLMERIQSRVSDPRFLRHLRRTLRNSILTVEGETKLSERGTPQGSPASPVLANICLHYLIDEWFMKHYSDTGEFVRYADDVVFIFSDEQEARDFLEALKERCQEAGLQLNATKSKVVSFSKSAPKGTISFVGFEHYWGRNRTGQRMLKVKTSNIRLRRSMQAFRDWIKRCRNRYPLKKLWKLAADKLQGHYQYFGAKTNSRRLRHFYYACCQELFKWLNRRSQKRSFTKERFERRLWFNPLPLPPFEKHLPDFKRDLDSEWKHKPRSRMRELRTYGSQRSAGRAPVFT